MTVYRITIEGFIIAPLNWIHPADQTGGDGGDFTCVVVRRKIQITRIWQKTKRAANSKTHGFNVI